MSEEDSFIVLGSTPTPSMENYLMEDGYDRKPTSLTPSQRNIMETSSTQIDSNNFSLIQADESLKSSAATQKFDVKSLSPPQSVNSVAMNGCTNNSLAASVIMGETKSSLLQAFPSLMSSSVTINEIQTLRHLINEHGQMKDSLQKANVAMRKNFSNIQKWQDEVKLKYAKQVRTVDEQMMAIGALQEENQSLKQALAHAESRAKEQDAHFQQEQKAAQKEMDDIRHQMEAERTSAGTELDELRKMLSEKQSILQNMARQIERLELEKQEFVVVNSNKPDIKDRDGLEFITKEEHDRQLKVLQREMSVVLAQNLQFEDMKKLFIDEINCLKVNMTAAEELHAKHRAEIHRMTKEIETKDVSLAENIRELKSLSEQVDVLTAQLDIYKNDFEAERSARAELASEKDRILSDLKLLQKRNQQLIDEVQNGRSAEESATRAANESLDRRNPAEVVAGSSAGGNSAEKPNGNEEQLFQRPVLHCPLCDSVFKDLSTLQNHVEDCYGTA
ncbi:NF-kappa-B essential modulator [Sabethes cyaneus]|uniref:NF-kappa-B essential modulator n=1 Tax=Sabethes cyaneus TaxID=53552 RepID=UPI00237D5801|nr:NF-kappa-B essential modulator [Sabethes cyaneus]XP_053689808.1 NF-kappa-B essential modulator [Sabethes cyaneus]XP_053689809.1 NF-kappa-B essential modulator [Sabethes cyaneus]